MTPAPLRRWATWVPAAVWAGVIFWLSSQPSLPSTDHVTDKQAHAITYAVLTVFCVIGLTAGSRRRMTVGVLTTALVMAVIYGASDEIHQLYVVGRSAEFADLIADTLGALLAVVLLWAWAILVGRRSGVARR